MNRIEERAMNLVKTIEDVYKATSAFAIGAFHGEIEVHLQPGDFGKIAEGRDTQLCEIYLGDNLRRKEMVVGGVKFFCLLTETEIKGGTACR